MSFTITKNANVRTALLKIPQFSQLTKKAIRDTFYNIGKDLVADTKKLINEKPKHGRIYKQYVGVSGRLKKPKYHVASAPGEAPAVLTGTLRNSINFLVRSNNEMIFGVDLERGNAYYGKYLEYKNLIGMSGKGSENIEPRPFISKAYDKNKNRIMTEFKQCIDRELKK